MNNKLHFCLVFIFFFLFNFLNAQTPGLIYKPAGNALGKSVLDPNGDGFASLDANGYTIGDDEGESELKMIALPKISEEPEGDTSTGASGGHTDNVSNSNGNALYVLVKTVNGVDYLIVRFRIGKASTASKGYSLMLDTDNVFGNQYSADNPGFEKEIVLETNNRVAIYSHNASGTTLTHSFDVNNYHQRSVAFSTVSGDPDYFYDFFVPLEALNATSLVRILGATITSAQSGINGTISDFSGIDDSAYGNNKQILYNQIIPPFPSVLLDDLREGFTFPLIKSIAPSITSNISANSTSISGVSQEANGTVISVLRNGTVIGTTTVTGNNWVLTGVSGLQVGDVITATAEASGKSVSDASIAKEVKGVQTCFTPRPEITNSANGQQTISGTWSDGTTISANTVQIEIYRANTSTSPHGFTQVFTKSGNLAYVEPDGTWTFSVDLQQNVFNTYTYYARAIKGGCASGYSNHRIIGNGTATVVPTLVTSPILASTGNTNITVTNNHNESATLYLYVNGSLIGTSTQVNSGANHVFSIPNLISGDIVYARATGTATTARLSNVSNSVTVTASTVQSVAPQISGTYIAGAGQPVSGTSTEEPGTVIRVFSGTTLLGTTTVDAFNNWELTNLSLTSGAILTATAQADGEIQSPSSAGVTVQASAPAAPSISGSYFVGNTSISGSGGTGTVTIYIDGAPIGTTTADGGGNWTLSGIPPTEMFRGAVLTATNTVNGIDSAFSNPTTVTGVVSFCITDENDDPVTDKKSGETFTIKITAIDAATCPGSLVTSFNGTVTLFSKTWIDPSGTTQNFTNGVLTLNNVSLGGLGPTNIQVINSSDPTAFGSTSLDITDPAIWEGNISTDFGNADNWVFNYVPADGADISFADGINVAETAARDCLLDADRILGSIDFKESPYKLDLNGNRFELRGDVSNSNTTTGSFRSDKTASLDIFGSNTLVTLYFSEDSGLGDFLINRASGSVTLGTPLDIYNLLTVENGTLNTNNQLTLKSISIPETAQVSPVNGEIDGEITIERYVPARRAFRFFSSAVNSTGSIRDNWQEGVNNPNTLTNLNPKLGYGTHITGSTSGNNGFDATASGNPSLFKLNNAGQQWVVIDNTDVNKIEAGSAYRMLVRGDRSIDVTSNSTPPTETIIRTTGVLQTNDYVPTDLNSTNESFNFIGNPYQRAVDMTSFLNISSGINNRYYYVWDPTLGGTPTPGEPGGRGAYVAVDVLDNTNNNAASEANKYLQPNQAFFIQSNGIGAADVRFLKRQAAVQQLLSSVFRAENKNEINIQLYTTNSYEKGDTPVDAVSIRFTEEDSNASDEQDAAKMINIDENLATSNNGKLHSIERRALPKTDDIIPLFTNQYRQNSYVFSISESGLQNVNAYLYDKYTGDKVMLESEQKILYPFTVSEENPNSKDSDRFEIVFENETLSVQNLEPVSQLNLYPNPSENGKFWITTNGIGKNQLNVSLINMVGQQLYSGTKEPNSNGLLSLDIPGLDAGVYIVMVSDGSGNTFTTKLIHK